jgi:hypothetical protein
MVALPGRTTGRVSQDVSPRPGSVPDCVLVVTPTTVNGQRARLQQEVSQMAGAGVTVPARLLDGDPEEVTTVVLSTQECLQALRDPKLARWCRHTAWDGEVPAGIGLPSGVHLLRAALGPATVLVGRAFLAELARTAAAVVRTAAAGSGQIGRVRLAGALYVPEPEFGITPPLAQTVAVPRVTGPGARPAHPIRQGILPRQSRHEVPTPRY